LKFHVYFSNSRLPSDHTAYYGIGDSKFRKILEMTLPNAAWPSSFCQWVRDLRLNLTDWLKQQGVAYAKTVAGTRASKEPDLYKFVKQTLENALFSRTRTGWLGGPGEG
jgi:hypothetical protein